jgi:hypothetical protein
MEHRRPLAGPVAAVFDRTELAGRTGPRPRPSHSGASPGGTEGFRPDSCLTESGTTRCEGNRRMKAPKLNLRGWMIALGALLGGLLIGGAPMRGCTSGCPPTPPTCCQPPPAPPKPPAPPTGCCGGGHNVNIPGVNVNIGATVIVNANSSASARPIRARPLGRESPARVRCRLGRGRQLLRRRRSWRLLFRPDGQRLHPGPERRGRRSPSSESYEATRTKMRRVIIRAVCLDDRDVPHPASQVTPDRDIDDAYDGELYRCIAGSRMQYVIADYSKARSTSRPAAAARPMSARRTSRSITSPARRPWRRWPAAAVKAGQGSLVVPPATPGPRLQRALAAAPLRRRREDPDHPDDRDLHRLPRGDGAGTPDGVDQLQPGRRRRRGRVLIQ